MPTDADFLRAVVADPDADAPRLAYADWLDECGDAARAEFIRVQCALAALPEEEQAYHPLTARENELESAHRDEWLRPFRELLKPGGRAERPGWLGWFRPSPVRNLIAAKFRRGLVDYLHLDTKAFLANADRLTRLTPLKALNLDPVSGSSPHDAWTSLSNCAALSGLTVLHVRTHRLRVGEVRDFAEGLNLTNLRALGLICPGFDRDAVAAFCRSRLLAVLSSLQMTVAGPVMSDPCADLIMHEAACRNLEDLYLAGMPDVTADFLQRLARSSSFTRLESLVLFDSPVGDVDLSSFLDWLPTTLTRLGLRRLELGDRAAASMATLPRIRHLRRLDLAHNRITDVGAMILADSPNLLASTRLDLTGNPISRRVQNALRVRLGHHVTV